VVAFGTDGEISAYNLEVLEDDKGMFPPYQVAPVIRQEALDANPEIRDLLNAPHGEAE
jgi:osmoprotectant transport system substrate-binding protein